ncbi:DUF6911 family protein [Enterobacter sp. 22452]|uniref:DUF6911 family protein n=1 Tax=Enterobacter TaxID=547 RepID=UPI003F83F53F
MNFKMSWTQDGNGGNKRISSWSEILTQLEQLHGREGTLTLDILTSVDTDAEMLQVRTESGYYLITLGEIFEDDYQIRTHWNPSKSDASIMILGDSWPERQLIKDFDLVARIFKEFFETGNVSTDLLN